MPALPKPRYEAFAQARARGATLDSAYEDAGFAPGWRHGARLAADPAVAGRIAEIQAAHAEIFEASPASAILTLIRLTKAGKDDDGNPQSIREKRVTLLEAARLWEQWAKAREEERESDRLKAKFDP